MGTILFTVLTALVGITVGLAIALATLHYYKRDEIFASEIRRQQDLHVSAQINALHRTIQALQRDNKTLMANNSKLASITVTRMNDTPVVTLKTAKTNSETVGG